MIYKYSMLSSSWPGKRDIILPIFWSEESVGEIEDAETLALLHKGVHAPQQATTGL